MSARIIWAGALILIGCSAPAAQTVAAPFVPRDPSMIVLRVRADPLLREARDLEQQLAQRPEDPSYLYSLVESYVTLGRRTGEPRYFGRAEALLVPRLQSSAAPTELRLQLADILQYRHEFAAALEQITQVLERERLNGRAHLMRAAIRQTAGEFADAKTDCVAVLGAGDTIPGTVCLAQVFSMTGQLLRARALLTELLQRTPTLPQQYSTWLLTALADVEERGGDSKAAETDLRRALDLDPYAHYARFALADLLLRLQRGTEVPDLFSNAAQTEGVLLRLAESRAAVGSLESNPYTRLLLARLDAARERGERVHARDLVRINLRLLSNPTAALEAARANWHEQREPIDARLLIEAGNAAGNAHATNEVLDWKRGSGYQDTVLEALLGRR